MKKKLIHRIKRHKKVRAKIKGTNKIPRVSVFRSNRHVSVQLIDDTTGKTILSNTLKSKSKSRVAPKGTKIDVASKTGEIIAQKAKGKGIKKVVFDRGGYKYHGRVKALAEGLRKGGLEF